MAPCILVTRPVEDAAALTQLLRARGYEVIHEPMLFIRFLNRTIDISDIQAVLITSANGARALASATKARSVPVFTVGDSSSRVCHEHGFKHVTTASGTVANLVHLIKSRLRPENGALLHAAGNVTAGDLGGQLHQAGFIVRKTRLYEAHPARTLENAQLIASGTIDAALFYSPRTAAIFTTLVSRTGISYGLSASRAYCLSEAVKSHLSELQWKIIRVSVAPNQESLLAAFDNDKDTLFEKSSVLTTHRKEEDMTKSQSLDESQGNIIRVWNVQNPQSLRSSEENDQSEEKRQKEVEKKEVAVSVETVTQHIKNTTKGQKRKANLAVIIIGTFLLFATSVWVGWMTLPWWNTFIPNAYRSYLPFSRFATPDIKADAREIDESQRIMTFQRAITSLRHDLDQLAQKLDEQQSSYKILEQQLFLLKQQVAVSRQVESTDNESERLTTPEVILQRLAALEAAVTEWTETETKRLETLTHQTTTFESELRNIGVKLSILESEKPLKTTNNFPSYREIYDRLTALEERTAAFRHAERQNFVPTWLLALLQLREAVYSGLPFKEELHAARTLAQDVTIIDQAVTGFIAYAVTGLPTRSAMTTRFEKLHREIARAALSSSSEGDSWLAHVLQRLQGSITIRRIETTNYMENSEDTLTIMSKASTALHAGDFLGTIRIMESLRGKPAEVAASWMTFARARATADEALSHLTAHALGQIAASHVKE